jgi:hypothetical protein
MVEGQPTQLSGEEIDELCGVGRVGGNYHLS